MSAGQFPLEAVDENPPLLLSAGGWQASVSVDAVAFLQALPLAFPYSLLLALKSTFVTFSSFPFLFLRGHQPALLNQEPAVLRCDHIFLSVIMFPGIVGFRLPDPCEDRRRKAASVSSRVCPSMIQV